MAVKRMLHMDGLEKRMRTLLLVLFLGTLLDMGAARGPGEQTAPVGEITCALVPDRALGFHESPVFHLLEVELSKEPGLALLERAQVDKILAERALQLAFSPQGCEERQRLGTLLGARVLVLLQASEKKTEEKSGATTRFLEVVVVDTDTGLRMDHRETKWDLESPQKTSAFLVELIKKTLARRSSGIRTIVAIPPFVSEDLLHRYDAMQSGCAALFEQHLAGVPNVWVIELEEAHAILNETAISGKDPVKRALQPYFINGRYRNTDIGGKQGPIQIHVQINQENTPVYEISKADVPPDQLGSWTASIANTFLQERLKQPAKPFDAEAEANELRSRSGVFREIGEWKKALDLLEAALLIRPNDPVLHVEALEVLPGVVRGFYMPQKPRPEFLDMARRALLYAQTGADHMDFILSLVEKTEQKMDSAQNGRLYNAGERLRKTIEPICGDMWLDEEAKQLAAGVLKRQRETQGRLEKLRAASSRVSAAPPASGDPLGAPYHAYLAEMRSRHSMNESAGNGGNLPPQLPMLKVRALILLPNDQARAIYYEEMEKIGPYEKMFAAWGRLRNAIKVPDSAIQARALKESLTKMEEIGSTGIRLLADEYLLDLVGDMIQINEWSVASAREKMRILLRVFHILGQHRSLNCRLASREYEMLLSTLKMIKPADAELQEFLGEIGRLGGVESVFAGLLQVEMAEKKPDERARKIPLVAADLHKKVQAAGLPPAAQQYLDNMISAKESYIREHAQPGLASAAEISFSDFAPFSQAQDTQERLVDWIPCGGAVDGVCFPGRLLVLREKGETTLVHEAANTEGRFTSIAYDGRWLWAALGGRILVVDPKKGTVAGTVSEEDGLPGGRMCLAALSPGLVCAAGGFDRGWCATVRFGDSGRKTVAVFHEARKRTGNTMDAQEAFAPCFAVAVRDPQGEHARVLVGKEEGKGIYSSLILQADPFGGRPPNVSRHRPLCQQDFWEANGAVYWAEGSTRAWYVMRMSAPTFASELFFRPAEWKETRVLEDERSVYLAFLGSQPIILNGQTDEDFRKEPLCWLLDPSGKWLCELKGQAPRKDLRGEEFSSRPVFTRSSHYGLLGIYSTSYGKTFYRVAAGTDLPALAAKWSEIAPEGRRVIPGRAMGPQNRR